MRSIRRARMVELISRGCGTAGSNPNGCGLVHSRPGGSGEFVLVEGVKGGREGLKVLPPLFIHEEGGGYTAGDDGDLQGSFRFSRSRRRLISLAMTRSRISRSSGSRTASRLSRIISRSRFRSGAEDGVGRRRIGRARRGGRDLADGEEEAPNLFLSGEFIDLAEDLLLQELELMQPDRGGDPDVERAPFQRVGKGLGGDLGTDGPPPECRGGAGPSRYGGCSSS